MGIFGCCTRGGTKVDGSPKEDRRGRESGAAIGGGIRGNMGVSGADAGGASFGMEAGSLDAKHGDKGASFKEEGKEWSRLDKFGKSRTIYPCLERFSVVSAIGGTEEVIGDRTESGSILLDSFAFFHHLNRSLGENDSSTK